MNPGALIPSMPFGEYALLFTVGILLIGLVIWKGSRNEKD